VPNRNSTSTTKVEKILKQGILANLVCYLSDRIALLGEAVFGLRAVFPCDCIVFGVNTSGFIPSWSVNFIDGVCAI
jgi:hypothetical protein